MGTTLQDVAREAASWLTTVKRGDESIVVCKDGAPEWVVDLVYAASGDFGPDDWRYASIASALEFVAESSDPEDEDGDWADGNVDFYTGARVAWLASNLNRAAYCDEAADEFGNPEADTVERIGLGQYQESREIYGSVLSSLQHRVELLETAEGYLGDPS